MKPKKQSSIGGIIAFSLLLIVAFIAIKIGIALDDVEILGGVSENGTINFTMLMERISIRLSETSLRFTLTENVKKTLMVGAFAWLIGFAAWYSSKKNYIHGKTYGTARWGTLQDISDLFAVNIMNKEIKQAKRVKTAWGRYFEHKKVLKNCKKNKEQILADDLKKIEEWKKETLAEIEAEFRLGYLSNKRKEKKELLRKYGERKYEAEKKSEAYFESSYTEAWYPAKLKKIYESEISDIEERYKQGIIISTEEERRKALDEAEKRYQTSLSDFYKGDKKIEKIKKKYENADSLLTKSERISIHNYVLNNNTLILGGSGSGKTRGFVLPNILQAHSSYVVTDPKGEILEKSGYFLEHVKGYKIRVLNLDDKASSDGYNPFKYIHPERDGYEERVLSLIEAIILNTDGGEKKNSSDPFWDKAERLFLQAVFFFTCDGFDEDQRNMNTVLSLIGMLEIKEDNDKQTSDLDVFAELFEERYGKDHIGLQQYREFRTKASGKTAKSIVISAVARLAPFRAKAVQRIFSYDSMELENVGEEKTAIFVVVPPTDTTFNFIAGMVFTQLFQELQYCATQKHKHEGQRLPVPVRFILDEFANTCQIPQFVKILAYARSFGIGITPILQSLEQIKTMYEKEWGVVIDNCNTLLFLGSITHNDTLEYMSKLLGKGTFDKRTTGRTKGKTGSSSQNFDEVGRELMDIAEIRKLPKKDCLLVVGGRNPFYSEKYDYTSHPNYKYTSDSNPAFSYSYTPHLPEETESPAKTRPHREDEAEAVRRSREEIERQIEAEKIEVITDSTQILSDVSTKLNYIAPIRNDLLILDDGESVDYDELLEAMAQDKAQQELLATIRKNREEIERQIEAEKIEVITDSTQILSDVSNNFENLAPIRNELFDDDITFDDVDETVNIEEDFGSLGGLVSGLDENINEAQKEMEK